MTNIKITFLYIFILLLLTIHVKGSKLKQPHGTDANVFGHVVDEETGEHIPFINIIIEGTRLGTLTDASGHYILTNLPTGNHTLVAKGMGYEPASIDFKIEKDQTLEVNIEISYKGIGLEEVILTSSPTRSGFSYQPNQAFAGEELQRRSDVSFGEMLDGEPGIAMRSLGPAPARPVVRGLDGDRILVLQNGERMGDIAHTSADHAISMDPLAASRVEVVRGPASMLYGSSALGGVVNIMTTDIPEQWPEGSTGVLSAQGATVNNMGAGFGRYTYGQEKWGATGRLAYRKAGDMKTPEGTLQNTSLENYDGAFGMGFENNKVNGGFSASLGNQTFEIPEAIDNPNEAIEIRAQRQHLQGKLNFSINDFFDKAEWRFSGSRFFQQEVEIEFEDNKIVDEDIEIEFERYNVSSTLTMQHQAKGIFDRGAIGFNMYGHNMDIGGDEAYTPGEERYTIGLFTFQEIPLSSMLRLQFGLRLDYQNTTALANELFPDIDEKCSSFNHSGSVGLNFRPLDEIEIGAQFARSHRNPMTEELFADGPHIGAGVYEVGNKELEDEIGNGGDLFIKWNSNNLYAEVAGFINHFFNYIISQPTGDTKEESGFPIYNYEGDEARLIGGEAILKWQFTENFELKLNADYVNGYRMNDDKDYLPFIPPFRLGGGLQYEYGQGWIAAGVTSAAKKKNTAPEEDKTAGYTLFDAQAGYRLDHGGRHVLIFKVENMLDTKYRDHLSRLEARDFPMPGRNFKLAYRFYF